MLFAIENFSFLLISRFPHQPLPDNGKHILLFFGGEFASFWDCVPFLKAAPAAAPCGVLGYEYGVVFHGCLLAVVGDVGGEQAGLKELPGMLHNGIKPLLLKIRQLPPAEVEAASEL